MSYGEKQTKIFDQNQDKSALKHQSNSERDADLQKAAEPLADKLLFLTNQAC